MKANRPSFFTDGHLAGLVSLAKHTSTARDFSVFVTQSLEFLRSCGFDSARYYECATSRPENDELLILSAQLPSTSKVAIGYPIRYRASTLGRASDPCVPAIGSCSDTNEQWVCDLQLSSECSWVDVPVRGSNRLIGLLAVAWRGNKERLSPCDVGILATLGCLVASVSESISAVDADRVEKAFTDALYKNADSVTKALKIAIDELVSTMNFGVVAVFERSRSGAKLTKVMEKVHPQITRSPSPFPEEYPVGEFLTGVAWEKAEYRHIVDFSALLKLRSHDVELKSLDRHATLLCGIKSVLYSKIEGRESRYMIRIMNCVDSLLPIVAAQQKIVTRITRTIASHVDDVLAKQRLDQVIDIARISSKNVTRPHEVVRHVRQAIIEDGFDQLIVIAKHQEQAIGAIFSDFPPEFKDPKVERLDWAELSLVQIMAQSARVVTHSLSVLSSSCSSPLFESIKGHGYEVLIVKPFESATIAGFIGIPSREPMMVVKSNRERISVGAFPYLIDTYAALICSCIDGYDSHVTAEGSRKFMGRS